MTKVIQINKSKSNKGNDCKLTEVNKQILLKIVGFLFHLMHTRLGFFWISVKVCLEKVSCSVNQYFKKVM